MLTDTEDDFFFEEDKMPEPLLIQLDGDNGQVVQHHKDLPEEPDKPSGAPLEATVMLCSPAGFSSDSVSGDRFGIESANRQKYELDRL